MSIGDNVISDGIEFEVIWDGGEGLIPERPTKITGFWSAPKRIYNKSSDYWTKPRIKRLKEEEDQESQAQLAKEIGFEDVVLSDD